MKIGKYSLGKHCSKIIKHIIPKNYMPKNHYHYKWFYVWFGFYFCKTL